MPDRSYSHVPLSRKLGIREGATVVVDGEPFELEALLAPLPDGVRMKHAADAGAGTVDVALAFAVELATLAAQVDRLTPLLTPAGGLWLCSPKKASRVPTDITFDRLQALGLDARLVDNKVASINEVWTGFRFVRRLRDRGADAS